MIILWDEPKRLANIKKHGLDFLSVTFDVLMNARRARPVSDGRFALIGKLESGRIVAMIVKPLGLEAVSIISLRPANKKERACYD